MFNPRLLKKIIDEACLDMFGGCNYSKLSIVGVNCTTIYDTYNVSIQLLNGNLITGNMTNIQNGENKVIISFHFNNSELLFMINDSRQYILIKSAEDKTVYGREIERTLSMEMWYRGQLKEDKENENN